MGVNDFADENSEGGAEPGGENKGCLGEGLHPGTQTVSKNMQINLLQVKTQKAR